MDIRDSAYIIQARREKKSKERLQYIIDTADAVQMGTFSTQSAKAFKQFEKWHRRIERQINPAIEETGTIWDRFNDRKSKRIN